MMKFREPQGEQFAAAFAAAAAGDYEGVQAAIQTDLDFKDPRCLACYFELLRHLKADDDDDADRENRFAVLVQIGHWFLAARLNATALTYYRKAVELVGRGSVAAERLRDDTLSWNIPGESALVLTAIVGDGGLEEDKYLRSADLYQIDGFTSDTVAPEQLEIIVSDLDDCERRPECCGSSCERDLIACTALHRLGRTEEACVRANIELLEQEYQADEDEYLPRLIELRAELLLALDQPEEALADCAAASRIYLARQDTDEGVQLLRIQALIALSRFEEAEAVLDRLAREHDWKWLHEKIGALRAALAAARAPSVPEGMQVSEPQDVVEGPGHLCHELLAFYGEDDGPAGNGYTRRQLLDWSDADWEREHDFIQWLFPTDQASQFNPDAPVLDVATATAFRADPLFRHRVRQSFDRWLAFCGVERTAKGLAFAHPRPHIWGTPNHHWLRVTRVLRSLRLLGLQEEAGAFFVLMQTIRPQVDAETWAYWETAANT